MDEWRTELESRAGQYADDRGIQIIGQLGYGYDGTVFATNHQSAIKVLRFERLFRRECDVYLRKLTMSSAAAKHCAGNHRRV